MGKKVSSNDILSFNHQTAIAFIENSCTILSDEDLVTLLSRRNAQSHRGFIASTFKGFYFLDAENKWLDTTVANIVRLREAYSGRTLREKRALAYWALGQACLAKRPFNLFHRRNLYLRTQRVDRTFGNKTTWETPFPVLFSRFARQANKAVFSNGHPNKAFNLDAFAFSEDAYDLVYLDPPYFFEGQRDVDYVQLYHFLEGLMQYERWPSLIDYGTCNLRMQKNGSQWPDTSPSALLSLYRELVSRFSRSIIVISHKSGSRVTIGAWSQILASVGKNVTLRRRRYNYALSKRNGQPRQNIEWLLVAK
jgi:adenine-specific DNA methylase